MFGSLSGPWLYGRFSRLGFLVAGAVLFLDQFSKYWVVHVYQLPGKGVVNVMPFVDLVMVWNPGVSYGLFKQSTAEGRILLIGIACVATIGLTIWLAKSLNSLTAISIGLIIGGAIGNAIDRFIYGAVADFVSLHAFGYHWYVFNVADAAIVAGVAGLLYDAAFPSRKNVSNVS